MIISYKTTQLHPNLHIYNFCRIPAWPVIKNEADFHPLCSNSHTNPDPDNLPPPMVTVPPRDPEPTTAPIENPYSCGSELLGVSNGSFHSPGFPSGNYATNKDCAWYIRGDFGHEIQVTFTTFHLDYRCVIGG